jgi:hypothetical protein
MAHFVNIAITQSDFTEFGISHILFILGTGSERCLVMRSKMSSAGPPPGEHKALTEREMAGENRSAQRKKIS